MKAENSNHLEVQNPLYGVEITVCASTASGDSERVLSFCRQIHSQYAQKLCISHRVQIPITIDRNGLPSLCGIWWWFFWLFSLFDFVVCFHFKMVEKMQGKIQCLQITQETHGTYQNWVHHGQMSFCKHIMILSRVLSFKQIVILQSDLKAARDPSKGSNGYHDLCW